MKIELKFLRWIRFKINKFVFLGVPKPAICIIDSHHVRVFIVKGEHFVIPMPFPIEKVWSSKFGILIEKGHDSTCINKCSK